MARRVLHVARLLATAFTIALFILTTTSTTSAARARPRAPKPPVPLMCAGPTCSCHDLDVKCEGQGLDDLSRLGAPPEGPFRLFLQRNAVRRLPALAFARLPGLSLLNLASNGLAHIAEGAFSGLAELRRLHVNRNALEELRNDTLLGLSSLEYLQADHNLLRRIESGAFARAPKLSVLLLNDNQLESLPAGLLQSSAALTALDLRGNRLKALPLSGILDCLGHLAQVQLSDNPWDCSACSHDSPHISSSSSSSSSSSPVLPLWDWLQQRPETAQMAAGSFDFPRCWWPPSLRNASLRDVPRSHLACPVGLQAPQGKSSPAEGDADGQQQRPQRPQRPDACPAACHCSPLTEEDSGVAVFCRERGLAAVPRFWPTQAPDARRLDLSWNLIEEALPDDFEGLGSLLELDLSHNRVASLRPGTFSRLRSLRRLQLSGNALTRLGPGVFAGLASLAFLDIERNAIREVGAGALAELPALRQLKLARNLLHELPLAVLRGPVELARLDVRGNRLSVPPVRGLGAAVQLELRDNPWHCDCIVRHDVTRWVTAWRQAAPQGALSTMPPGVSGALCEGPAAMAGRSLASLRSDEPCVEAPTSTTPAPAGPHVGTPRAPETSSSSSSSPPPAAGPEASLPLHVFVAGVVAVFIVTAVGTAGIFVLAMRRKQQKQQRSGGKHRESMVGGGCSGGNNGNKGSGDANNRGPGGARGTPTTPTGRRGAGIEEAAPFQGRVVHNPIYKPLLVKGYGDGTADGLYPGLLLKHHELHGAARALCPTPPTPWAWAGSAVAVDGGPGAPGVVPGYGGGPCSGPGSVPAITWQKL
uniref:SLIT and NTRK-like protein 3 n=1 Tax=Petromyzon marinus TaxID=7757 RepID=A0AAJ7U147_PETMA|nr:SLIT and NTRK-like protein 3 [Petromyzon marinus]